MNSQKKRLVGSSFSYVQDLDEVQLRRFKFVMFFSTAIFTIIIASFMLNFIPRDTQTVLFYVCTLAIIVLSFFSLRRAETINRAVNFFVLSATIMVFYSYLNGGIGNAGFIWMYPLVIAYFYLQNSTLATVWASLCILFNASMTYAVWRSIIHLPYDYHLLTLHTACLIISAGWLFYYSISAGQNEVKIAEQNKLLTKVNESLHEEIQAKKQVEEELHKNFRQIAENNHTLERTKRAMLNLLEDAKMLEEELKKEKVSVEKKIIARTDELREEQARLNASINSLESGFLITLKDGSTVTYNNALQRLFKLDVTNNTNGIKLNMFHIIEKKLRTSLNLEEVIRTAITSRKSVHVQDVEYENKFFDIFCAPIHSSDKKQIIGSVVLIEDVTAAKLLERSKDEFVSIASHELRTPLTAIRGNASMLLQLYGDKFTDTGSREIVDDIHNASTRLIGVVNQFLSMSRLEQKRTEFTMTKIALSNVAKKVVSTMTPIATQKNIALNFGDYSKLPAVKADEVRIEEVFMNVVDNAIKYTETGSVTIVIERTANYVKVKVTDTGKGIDPKNHSLLFHKFQQASANILTRDDSRSTGLGLYISKLLIEQMGGTIQLEQSQIGVGSTFSFTIPIYKE
jgi:signal transduction histidine kinase